MEQETRALHAARQMVDQREQQLVAREAAMAEASQVAQAQAEAASQLQRTARHQQAHSRGGALGDTQSSQLLGERWPVASAAADISSPLGSSVSTQQQVDHVVHTAPRSSRGATSTSTSILSLTPTVDVNVPIELRMRLKQLLESLQRVDTEGDARLTRLDSVLRSMNAARVTASPGAGELTAVAMAIKTLRGRLSSLQAAGVHLMAAASTASSHRACSSLVQQLEGHQQKRARWERDVATQLDTLTRLQNRLATT
jgi:DNA repair exonuclease SbcCD ATPase subunit